MATLSQINNAVAAYLDAHHPELAGHVHYDTAFDSHRNGATIFLTTVSINDSNAYRILNDARGGYRNEHILNALTYYQGVNENDGIFEIERTRYLIGDGDDTMAVTEYGHWSVRIWVRTGANFEPF